MTEAKAESCCCGCAAEVTEQELMARLDEVLEQYRDVPGALIPVLQIAQGIFGYLPKHVMQHISRSLNMPPSEVAGVVSFYSFFSTVPRGKHVIRVCLGTACYVRGGIRVLEALKKKLKIDVGQTTDDRLFTLGIARCFGACGLAPVITVDDEVFHRVNPNKVEQILCKFREPAATTQVAPAPQANPANPIEQAAAKAV